MCFRGWALNQQLQSIRTVYSLLLMDARRVETCLQHRALAPYGLRPLAHRKSLVRKGLKRLVSHSCTKYNNTAFILKVALLLSYNGCIISKSADIFSRSVLLALKTCRLTLNLRQDAGFLTRRGEHRTLFKDYTTRGKNWEKHNDVMQSRKSTENLPPELRKQQGFYIFFSRDSIYQGCSSQDQHT